MELLPDEDFRRVLCVVAHPDDLEYGVSAAVASWVARGVEVSYLLLTSGEAGMQRDPAETGPLRAPAERQIIDMVFQEDGDGIAALQAVGAIEVGGLVGARLQLGIAHRLSGVGHDDRWLFWRVGGVVERMHSLSPIGPHWRM